mgnify:CR=1 FL=1
MDVRNNELVSKHLAHPVAYYLQLNENMKHMVTEFENQKENIFLFLIVALPQALTGEACLLPSTWLSNQANKAWPSPKLLEIQQKSVRFESALNA